MGGCITSCAKMQGPATPGEPASGADVIHFASYLSSIAEELQQVSWTIRDSLVLSAYTMMLHNAGRTGSSSFLLEMKFAFARR